MATTTQEAAGHAAEAGHLLPGTDAHGAAVGMPQLVFETYPNQIFWLAVALVLIYLVLSRIALPRIGGVLAERAGTITNDLATAEELKLKAKEAEAAYTKALAEARTEAQRIIAAAKAEIKEELKAATAKADAEIAVKTAESEARIAEIRAGALEAVDAVARETAAEIVAAFGAQPDQAAVDAAVAQQLGGRA